jgi:hypothetical protein
MRVGRDTLGSIVEFLYQPAQKYSFGEVCRFYTSTCSLFHTSKALYQHSAYHKQQAAIRLSGALRDNNQSSPPQLQTLLKCANDADAFLRAFSSFIFQGKTFVNDDFAMCWMSQYGTASAKYHSLYKSKVLQRKRNEKASNGSRKCIRMKRNSNEITQREPPFMRTIMDFRLRYGDPGDGPLEDGDVVREAAVAYMATDPFYDLRRSTKRGNLLLQYVYEGEHDELHTSRLSIPHTEMSNRLVRQLRNVSSLMVASARSHGYEARCHLFNTLFDAEVDDDVDYDDDDDEDDYFDYYVPYVDEVGIAEPLKTFQSFMDMSVAQQWILDTVISVLVERRTVTINLRAEDTHVSPASQYLHRLVKHDQESTESGTTAETIFHIPSLRRKKSPRSDLLRTGLYKLFPLGKRASRAGHKSPTTPNKRRKRCQLNRGS